MMKSLFLLVAALCISAVSGQGAAQSSEPVFSADQLVRTFARLESRHCLPDGFDASVTERASQLCDAKVTPGDLPGECREALTLALSFNCFASSTGMLDASATSFDIATLEDTLLSFSDDVSWKQTGAGLMAACRQRMAQLTPRRQAVYSLLCLHWSLFSDCDRQREERGALDTEGALRRAHFLSGDCQLSPRSLLDTFRVVTGRTWQECSQGRYTGSDAALLYAGQVSRAGCLLQNFTNAGNVDFPRLISAINSGHADDASTASLLKLIGACATHDGLKKTGSTRFHDMTTAEFVSCWATEGVLVCAQETASQVARRFPETCAVSVDLS